MRVRCVWWSTTAFKPLIKVVVLLLLCCTLQEVYDSRALRVVVDDGGGSRCLCHKTKPINDLHPPAAVVLHTAGSV